jgi:hypothetical protein
MEVKDSPSSVVDREPGVEQLEVNGRNDEEVHPHNQILVGA